MAKPSKWDRRCKAPPDPDEIAQCRAKEVLTLVNWHLATLPREHAMQVLLAAARSQKARQPDQQTTRSAG
jgi:hypothetical protein